MVENITLEDLTQDGPLDYLRMFLTPTEPNNNE